MKKGTITLKQLRKLFKEVADTAVPTKLYSTSRPKSFTYLKLSGGEYTKEDKALISFLKKS